MEIKDISSNIFEINGEGNLKKYSLDNSQLEDEYVLVVKSITKDKIEFTFKKLE